MNVQEVNDISRYLDQRINDQLTDAMDTLMRCGHSPLVGSAVAVAAAEHLLKGAISMWISQVADHRREAILEETLLKVVDDVRSDAPRMLAIVRGSQVRRE